MTQLQEDIYVHEMLTCVEMSLDLLPTDLSQRSIQTKIVVFVSI